MHWTRAVKKVFAARLRALKPFDPYHSPLCTCGPKLTLNVYTGCGLECFYCYTSSYARGRWGRDSGTWGPRSNLAQDIAHDIARIGDDPAMGDLRALPVVVSLSSDPYPETPRVSESALDLTRHSLARLTEAGFAILVQTKSDLVVRDLDVLVPGRTVIGLTVTTLDESLARLLEPYAPPPALRIEALRAAKARGFPTICRIDPLVPGVNDDEAGIAALVEALAAAGVNQVVSSTFKTRPDSAARFAERFPLAAARSECLYERTTVSGYRYLVEPERRRRMELVRRIAESHGIAFSCCREGMPELNTHSCDGQHLVK